MSSRDREQTANEEMVNSLIAGAGALLGAAGLALLVTFAGLRGDAWRVVSFAVYGATLVLLYLASTLYHAVSSPRLKSVFHVLDHAAIFLLIAGTYTPFTLVTLRGPWGWSLFGVIWGLAAAGIVLKIFFTGRFKAASVALYLAMGWLVVIAGRPLVHALPWPALAWLTAGGLSYTLGVVFYVRDHRPYHHAVWHVFVLGGSVSHFFAMLFYVLPMPAAPPPSAAPLPNSYWVVPGKLLAGEHPGDPDPAAARSRLAAILDSGVDTFIDLTEGEKEGLSPYEAALRDLAAGRGRQVSVIRMPVTDFGVPTPHDARSVLDSIDTALSSSHPVYLHCHGGIGRTGTMVGLYLVEHGLNGGAALEEIARLRAETSKAARRSPETDEQRAFVTSWRAGER